MRRSGALVARILGHLASLVKPGVSTFDLEETAEKMIRDAGAQPAFKGYYSAAAGTKSPFVLCTSVNDEIVHGIPGERMLREGDLLSIDCGAIVDGWHGDAAISLIVGGREVGRPEDVALMDATAESLWAGIGALEVGRGLYAVGAAIEDSLTQAGERDGRTYGIVEDYVGHGIGREMHMEPNVPNYRVRGKGPTVKNASTLAIEPMVTLGQQDNRVLDDDWTVVTLDGSRASHWEHTVAAHSGGLWVLTAMDGGAARLGAKFAPLDV